MLLFFVEYFLAFVIAVFDNKRNRTIILCLFSLFTFLFAFRNITMNTGSDIDAYRYYYDNLNNSQLIARFAFEPGYYIVNKAFKVFHLPFEALMVSIGIFFCVLFWKSASRLTETPGVCLLSSIFIIFYYAIGALRQCIAQVLIFYAFYYLSACDLNEKQLSFRLSRKKEHSIHFDNLKRYYIFAIIAILFHRTAIILLFIPLLNKKRNRIVMWCGGLALDVLFPYIERLILMIPYIAGKYGAYKISSTMDSGDGLLLSFRLLEYLLIICVLFFEKNKSTVEELSLYLLELGVVLQVFLVHYISGIYRFLQYTDLGIVLFAATFYKRIKTQHWKILYTLGIAIVVFYRFYSMISSGESLGLHYSLIGF